MVRRSGATRARNDTRDTLFRSQGTRGRNLAPERARRLFRPRYVSDSDCGWCVGLRRTARILRASVRSPTASRPLFANATDVSATGARRVVARDGRGHDRAVPLARQLLRGSRPQLRDLPSAGSKRHARHEELSLSLSLSRTRLARPEKRRGLFLERRKIEWIISQDV